MADQRPLMRTHVDFNITFLFRFIKEKRIDSQYKHKGIKVMSLHTGTAALVKLKNPVLFIFHAHIWKVIVQHILYQSSAHIPVTFPG